MLPSLCPVEPHHGLLQLYRSDAERSAEAAVSMRLLLGNSLEGAAAALPALLGDGGVRALGIT